MVKNASTTITNRRKEGISLKIEGGAATNRVNISSIPM